MPHLDSTHTAGMSDWEIPLLLTCLCLGLLAFKRRGELGLIWISGVGLSALCLALVAGVYGHQVERPALPAAVREGLPSQRSGDGRIGAAACRACHPDQYTSWAQTWHRTMTQVATPETALGDFDDVTLTDRGVTWHLSRDGDQLFAEQIRPPAGGRRPVIMTTGAHHMQNYWMPKADGTRQQLPFAWWVRDARWIPTADSFLQPAPAEIFETIWDDTCNSCHTVGSVSFPEGTDQWGALALSELGVSCEACHGPGADHAAANRSPVRRYLRYTDDERAGDPTVVNAARLSPAASKAACGQCHGLFMTRDWRRVSVEGDPFTAGDLLHPTRIYTRAGADPTQPGEVMLQPLRHLSPVVQVSAGEVSGPRPILGTTRFGLHLGGDPLPAGPGHLDLPEGRRLHGTFEPYPWGTRMRPGRWPPRGLFWLLDLMGYGEVQPTAMDMSAFWPDGTIRTTGREMNGLEKTPCATVGEMTCLSCHSMHRGDPNDLMRPETPATGAAANAACTQCHPMSQADLTAHTHHGADSAGSLCYNCHMPHTSYGLMGAIRAHRVDSPRAANTQATGRPDACSLCHLNRPLAWTGRWLRAWYDQPEPEYTEADVAWASGARWLLEGDAAQRAVVAWHAGWGPTRTAAEADAWTPPLLAELLTDDYAVVRYIAAKALQAQPAFSDLKYDYVGPPEDRAAAAAAALSRWRAASPALSTPPASVILEAPGRPAAGAAATLKGRRDQQPVYIAE